MRFNFDIEYKAGLEYKVADALSKVDGTAMLMILSVPRTLELTAIRNAIEDTDLGRVLNALRNGQTHSRVFFVAR